MSDSKIKNKKLTKLEKFGKNPISSYSSFYAVFKCLTYPNTFKIGWGYIFTAVKNFWFLQWGQRLGFTKIPVINVDHELDNKIPFVPEKIESYLSFVSLYLKPISMIIKCFGIKKTANTCNEFFSAIGNEYKEAADFYRQVLSTTNRPKYYKNSKFRLIHFWDSHILCVPSLHIAVVALTYSFFKKKFKELGFSDAECFQKNTELYNHSIEIAESVLYVKQHSVNCVPAALYMTTKLFPQLFTPNDAVNFINDMFLTSNDIKKEDLSEIKDHISFMYERFLLEGYSADDWKESVYRWITSYEIDNETKNIKIGEKNV